MEEPGEFVLELASGELLWLARALGKVDLRLPGRRSLSYAEGQAHLRQGGLELARRGMLQPTAGVAWQLDRSLALLMEWLSAPERLLLARVMRPPSQEEEAGLYFRGGQGLFLEVIEDGYRLRLFRQVDDLRARWEAFLGFPALPAAPAGPAVDLPEPWALWQLFRREDGAAGRALQRHGLPPAQVEAALDLLKRWQSLAEVRVLLPRDGTLHEAGMCFFASDGTHLWATEIRPPGEAFCFAPVEPRALPWTEGNPAATS